MLAAAVIPQTMIGMPPPIK